MLESVLFLYRHRAILKQTTLNDIRSRFAGSLLGLSWLVVYPLLLLGAYAAVYIFIFKIRFELFNSNEYVALIFCGLIPFLGISEALGMGVGSVVSNANLIKNTLFPIELIPAKAVLVAQCTQTVGMGLLLIVLGVMGKLTFVSLLFLAVWVLQLMFSIGIIWMLSSINVFFRDLQNMVSVLILILMMVSPIAYPAEMIPANLRPFLALNPLYYFIVAYQELLMFGRMPSVEIAVPLVAISIFAYMLGFVFFKKMKGVFADNV